MRPRLLPILVLLLGAGCSKAGGPKKVPEPAELIAVVSSSSPTAALGRLRAYAEAVSPGAGGMMRDDMVPAALSTMVGAPALAGVAVDKPAYLLVLDPKRFEKAVLLVTVGDADKLKATTGAKVVVEGKWAVVGPAASVDLVSPYAFGVVAHKEAPAATTLSCSPAKIVGIYRADIEKFRKEMPGQLAAQSPGLGKILEVEIDLFLRLADQTDAMRVALDADNGEAWFELALAPKAGTTFAGWNAAQKQGFDLGLLDRLPMPAQPTGLIVGQMTLGPLRDMAFEMMDSLISQTLGQKMDKAKWNALLDQLDGGLAAVTYAGPNGEMSFDEVVSVADGPTATKAVSDLLPVGGTEPKTVEFMGMKMTWQRSPETTHAGAPLLGYEMKLDLSTMPEMQQAMMKRMYGDAMRVVMGGVNKTMVISMGPDAATRIPAVLDHVAKGGAPATLSPAAKAAFDAAKGRKATLAMFMDVAHAMASVLGAAPPSSSGMLIELAAGGDATKFRMGVPAAHVKEIMSAFGGGR